MAIQPAPLRAVVAIFMMVFAVCGAARTRAYDAVRIVAPADAETVHNNNGDVTVLVRISPPLDAKAGDHIVLLLDGRAAARGRRTRFELKGVDRGTHNLQAQIAAADGSLLEVSPVVTFYLWRASRLFPNRQDGR